jgi:hypothetical protein
MVEITRELDAAGDLILSLTLRVKLGAKLTMLEQEEAIQLALNEAGRSFTTCLMEGYDTEGDPLLVDGVKFTAKSHKIGRLIESPYGTVPILRWAYQSSAGGECFHPMDTRLGLIGSATPKFAKMVSSKFVDMPGEAVLRDLADNHQRKMSLDQLQQLVNRVGERAAFYEPGAEGMPKPEEVAVISIGVDAACVFMTSPAEPSTDGIVTDGRKGRRTDWRHAMVGTISFYNQKSELLGTFYTAQAPPEELEDGKKVFWERFEREVTKVKALFPEVITVGISDGAVDLGNWLKENTDIQVLDFFHAAEYLNDVGAAYEKEAAAAAVWAAGARRELLEVPGAAEVIYADMQEQAKRTDLGARAVGLEAAITYFGTRLEKMDYATFQANGWPIGSGVTESACKRIIKQRLGGSGMKWSFKTAQNLLQLRSLLKSDGRWHALWKYLSTT